MANIGFSVCDGHAFFILGRVRTAFDSCANVPCVGPLADGLGYDAKGEVGGKRGQLGVVHGGMNQSMGSIEDCRTRGEKLRC